MRPPRLHPRRRDGPQRRLEVDLIPCRAARPSASARGQNREPQGPRCYRVTLDQFGVEGGQLAPIHRAEMLRLFAHLWKDAAQSGCRVGARVIAARNGRFADRDHALQQAAGGVVLLGPERPQRGDQVGCRDIAQRPVSRIGRDVPLELPDPPRGVAE